MDKMSLKDEDLFIDLKLGSDKAIQNLFQANTCNIMKERDTNADISGKPNLGFGTMGKRETMVRDTGLRDNIKSSTAEV